MRPMTLKAPQKRYLRSQAHHLRAFMHSGNKGITDAFVAELDQVLDRHELVKVRLSAGDRAERAALIEQLATASGADVVQTIGHTVTLFRRNPDDPKIALPA